MPRDEWKRANDRAKYGPVRRHEKPFRTRKRQKKRQTRFEIPAGTVVSICRANDINRKWVAHRTRIRLQFDSEHNTTECRGTSGAVIFKYKGYLILTRRKACLV
jgi:hypothetical protein